MVYYKVLLAEHVLLEWNGLEWIARDWNGLQGIGMDWPGLAWPGLAWLGLAGFFVVVVVIGLVCLARVFR